MLGFGHTGPSRALAVALGVVGLVLWAGVSKADDTHYRGIPIGAHAIGLGGAFAGVADDVSAAYFNPGGLALGGTVGIAAGFSINAWQREDLDRALAQPDGVARATTRSSRTVPIFVGAVVKLGPKLEDGERRYSVGISVVEPIFSAGQVFLRFRSGLAEQLSDSYRLNNSDRGTWYGISFAGRLDPKQSLGASLYLSVRRLNQSETGLTLSDGTPIPGEMNSFVGAGSAANTQSVGFKSYHFVLRFGWLRRMSPRLQLGLMLQLPGIPLRQTVDVFSQGFANDNQDPGMPTTTDAYFLDQKTSGNLPLPGEIEAGIEFWAAKNVMLAMDVSLHFPVPSRSRVELDTTVPIGGLFFDNDTKRRTIGNVAVAGDFFIGKIVSLEAGFFTDLSSAAKIPEDPTRFHNARIHRFGGTLSVGFDVAGIALAVGSTVIFGRGDATGVTVDLNNFAVDYTRTQATSRIVYLHVTGATQAAEDISKKATKQIRKRQKRKQQEQQAEEAGDG